MKLDSNLAWKAANGLLAANREVLAALAGVFFLLPGLAFSLLAPVPPTPQANLAPEKAMAIVGEFYVSILPYVIPMALLQAVGTLAILTLFTDRTRPTVSEAIGRGLGGLVPYVLSQLLLGMGIVLAGSVLVLLADATGSAVVQALAIMLLLMALLYVSVRSALTAPVIAVEGIRNPLAALLRSWQLTRANAARILVFLALLVLAASVIMGVVTMIVGLVFNLILGAETGGMVTAVVSSLMTAALTLYLVAILAAIHRQLAGPSAEQIGRTFE